MCQACHAAFSKSGFLQRKKQANFIMWNMTAFPFADSVHFAKQVAELAKITRPRKRGFVRRLYREFDRQEAETTRLLKECRED